MIQLSLLWKRSPNFYHMKNTVKEIENNLNKIKTTLKKGCGFKSDHTSEQCVGGSLNLKKKKVSISELQPR